MKVLISAYACEPYRGSEPGAGWNWVLAATRKHDACVITRANNRAVIERALAEEPNPSVRFEYVDLPRWARFWKRGKRGIRLYYTIWQLLAAKRARRLQQAERFDIVHHLTFANMWLPALACLAGSPFVLGPIGGGQRVPFRLYGALGVQGAATEALLLTLRLLSRVNPLVRLAWRRADLILVNNEETRAALPARYRAKAHLRPNACMKYPPALDAIRPPSRRLAMYAGRLNRFKGVSLAVMALQHAPDWELVIVGSGNDLKRLRRLVRRLKLDERVRFHDLVPQPELWQQLAACRALILPSLKEGAPFIAIEAQALGVPVVAFDLSGPAALARFFEGSSFYLVPPASEKESVRGLADALRRLENAPAPTGRPDVGLESVSRDLDSVYRRAARQSMALPSEAWA
jgi:glycosyltransferase involved in cell wall biosynthesis